MSYKPRSRKRTPRVTGRQLSAIAAVVLLGFGSWYAYQTYFVKPPPVYATVNTSLGSFEIELFPASAPRTVSNFATLAESGFYNNLAWHRIVKGVLIQTGDPQTRNGGGNRSLWGQEKINTSFPLEIDPSLHNYEGFIGVAIRGTSQFYINLSNSSSNLSLDGNYTVFGKVISGMNVVIALSDVPLCVPPTCPATWAPDEPLNPVYVTSIVILKSP